ncbi:MAG: substrate-binding domain-containing protein [Bacteroidales bacterium]|nr:substrate-binding domain-containing protein [Bacteroidales bacterium]
MSKRYFLLLFLLSAVALLVGCSRGDRKLVIGVSQCSEDIWRTKLNQELLVSSHFYDNVEIRFESADDDSRKQIAQISRFVADQVDLLIISPNQTQAIAPAVEAAFDAGIPVILFDRKIDSDKYTAFIGADNVEIGRIMGHHIADVLGRKGRILEIQGLEGSSPASDRHEGFLQAISDYPELEVVGSYYGGWLQEGGRNAMKEFLAAGGQCDAVFAQNDRMARGAREVTPNPSSVRFFGIDALAGENGGLNDVINGDLDASYVYPTRGDMVMELAMDILSGRPYQRENRLESALVDSHNAKMLMMQEDEISGQQEKVEWVNAKLDNFLTQYNLQRLVLWLMLGFLALLIVAVALFSWSYIHTRRLNAELATRNQELQDLSHKLEESMANKLDFFTSVSHDLRTPLSLVAGPLEHVLTSPLSSDQRKSLTIARRNVDFMLRLVGNILDFRKIENGSMQLKMSRFDLAAAIQEWMTGFMDAALDRTFRYDGPKSLMVEADMHLAERALFNLLSNAFKFTPAGGSVTVSLVQDGGEAILAVRDTGKGISRDKLPFIFDRFYQAGDTSSSGTGIGLALVRSIAALHGGAVSVDSQEGQGSCFSIRFPLTHPGMDVEEASLESAHFTESYLDAYSGREERARQVIERMDPMDDRFPTILVVDDNEDLRSFIQSLLSGECRVLTAADGEEAFQKATREQPDLIISDVMMPVMDGLECCRRLKAQLATSHIPVILLTAKSLDEQRAEGYDSGADAYISKPFSEKVLLTRINNLLRSRAQLKEHYLETGESLSPARENDFLARFRSIVQKNLAESDLNVEQIAAEMGLGRVQLFRKVKSLTGYSPQEIIRIMRLKAAERLLKTTDLNVSEIAYKVGFGTPSYFSKCYREFFGKQPNEDR